MMRKPKKKTAAQVLADLEALRLQEAERRAQAAASARNPENWGADDTTLAQQPDVEVREARRGGAAYHHRRDDMHRLHAREAISSEGLAAYRRLEGDQARAMGEGDAPSSTGERVDSTLIAPSVYGRIEAQRKVDAVLNLLQVADRALLTEMVAPSCVLAPPFGRWRLVVAVVCGERDDDKRSAHLERACDALAAAYRVVDSGERRAA